MDEFDEDSHVLSFEAERERRSKDPYSFSTLGDWFELDLWEKKEAACLICDMDPSSAEIKWSGNQGIIYAEPVIVSAQFLKEGSFFYTLPRAMMPDEEQTKFEFNRELQGAKLEKSNQTINLTGNPAVDFKIFMLSTAQAILRRYWRIWQRATDTPGMFGTAAPIEYVAWAVSRGIEISWLDWAEHNAYLAKEPKTETPVVIDAQRRVTPSDKRYEEGLRAAITILGQKHTSGKLRDWQDFQKCMSKAVVIKYIRNNPTDFPHCAKIKPVIDINEGQSIKDREPTLTRSFPDFTKTIEIVDEYERLTSTK